MRRSPVATLLISATTSVESSRHSKRSERYVTNEAVASQRSEGLVSGRHNPLRGPLQRSLRICFKRSPEAADRRFAEFSLRLNVWPVAVTELLGKSSAGGKVTLDQVLRQSSRRLSIDRCREAIEAVSTLMQRQCGLLPMCRYAV